MVPPHTERLNQARFYPFVLRHVSVVSERALGHLRYHLTDVPPQPNSPSDGVVVSGQPRRHSTLETAALATPQYKPLSKKAIGVVVFHC